MTGFNRLLSEPIWDLGAPGSAPSKSLPNDPLTLDDWLSAEATLEYECHSDGTADIEIEAENLIVNGVYTIWGVFRLDTDSDGTFDTIIPVALGGVPNIFIADEDGEGSIERTINLCPDQAPSLLNIDVAYHSDGIVYGALPELPLGGLPGGLATHDQINFPINVAGTVGARPAQAVDTPVTSPCNAKREGAVSNAEAGTLTFSFQKNKESSCFLCFARESTIILL